MDQNALKLAARFSLSPNQLGYCGQDSAGETFEKCIISGDCAGVEEEISHFIVLYSYLKTIGEITRLSPLSYPVVESYWLGNEQLKKIKLQDYDLLLRNFTAQGVPEWLVQELAENKPDQFIPSHLFQVLHVGVGRASGSVRYNLGSINNCMIRWGKVELLKDQTVRINLNSLQKDGRQYKLTKIRETVRFNPNLVTGLKRGNVVAVHWGWAVKILNTEEKNLLNYWTREVLKSFEK